MLQKTKIMEKKWFQIIITTNSYGAKTEFLEYNSDVGIGTFIEKKCKKYNPVWGISILELQQNGVKKEREDIRNNLKGIVEPSAEERNWF